MTTETTEPDLITEVETFKTYLEGYNSAVQNPTLAQGGELLRRLVEEVKAHREHFEFCFHNHVMESELEKARAHTPSIVEANRLLDEAGYGKEPPNSLPEMIKKALAENAALREQMAKAHTNVESLTQTIFRSEQATRMRDLCVEKVKTIKDAYDLQAVECAAAFNYDGEWKAHLKAKAATEIITTLQSLTLEQEQK